MDTIQIDRMLSSNPVKLLQALAYVDFGGVDVAPGVDVQVVQSIEVTCALPESPKPTHHIK